MEETTVSIIGIMIAALLMYIVPLTLISDRADDLSQLVTQTVTADFVDEVIKTGKITEDSYQKFRDALSSTGNLYEINMELKILDENLSKWISDNYSDEIGSNKYYSIYTSQIEEIIGESSKNTENNREGQIILKHGDAFSVTVKNNSKTLSQSLKSFYYNEKGSNSQIIVATASGIVVIDGTTYKE